MIEFPITELMDEQRCLEWLEQQWYPEGWVCPYCGSAERRPHRPDQKFPSYRCGQCKRYYTLLTGTSFAKTHQPPSKVILLIRGISRGESSSLLARDTKLSYRQTLRLRHRLQQNVADSAPSGTMQGFEFEADELYQNSGEKKHAPS